MALTKELNDVPVNDFTSEKLGETYKKLIRRSRLLTRTLVDDVARAASKVAIYYQPVKEDLKKSRTEDYEN